MSCASTPISFLRLERYHLGELDEEERTTIARHLETCAACKECLRTFEVDDAPLLPLPTPLRRPRSRARAIYAVASVLAAAALFFVILGRGPRVPDDEANGANRTKGNDITFALVHESAGTMPEAGGLYREGDRFKASITCPPGMRATWDVVAYENGEASFPLAPESDLACGNAVTLRGAFRVTGAKPMTICLVWADGPLDREALRRSRPTDRASSRCTELSPAP